MRMDKINDMRDCVREAYLHGISSGYYNKEKQKYIYGGVLRKMTHALIAEFKRLGFEYIQIKDLLLEWNSRLEKPLPIGEEKRRLLDFVDWFKHKECKMGCGALIDYCLGEEKCQFYIQYSRKRQEETPKLPFEIEELEKYLRGEYPSKVYPLILIVKAIRKFQVEKSTGQVIFIGYRTIASMITDSHRHRLEAMEIQRLIYILMDEGVMEKICKGQAGTFGSRKANGYRFLHWAHP